MRIAIIGSGISGLGAAWLLHTSHDITVYEAESRTGGHSHTVNVDYEGYQIPVDAGFIVFNEQNYPNLTALFARLGVATEASDMSFAVSTGNGAVVWASGNLNNVFAQRRNLFSRQFISTMFEIQRFNKTAPCDLAGGKLHGLTLQEYLDRGNYSKGFRANYLFPMGGAVWSMPNGKMLDFPAESFVTFCNNHFLMSRQRPRWRTVTGGSREYVNKLTAPFSHRVRMATPVTSVTRQLNTVRVRDANGGDAIYDHVIIATHADQALRMLGDADFRERDILGKVRYAANLAYVHRDSSLMPRLQNAWASWNYMSAGDREQAVSVSYWMNRLQNIDSTKPLFITLNPLRPPHPELTFMALEFDHVQYDMNSLRAQQQLQSIQGARNTWFCGAWTAHGFHEDGLCSGLAIAEQLGGTVRTWSNTQSRAFKEAAE